MSNNILDEIREKTKNDLKENLKKHKKCALIRCTGFGKTWLLADLTREYKSVLYLYPAAIIRQTAVNAIEMTEEVSEEELKELLSVESDNKFDYRNIRFMTYTKISKMSRDEIKALPDYDLVIMDEVHRIGAKLCKPAILWLMFYKTKTHFIGATATPERMDAFDVVAEYFNGICVYPYTLHDAVQDGIIKMPYYVYCTYDIESSYKAVARQNGINDVSNEVLNSRLMEVCEIHNLPNIIEKTVKKYVSKKSYMKYIVFFSTIKQLNTKLDKVCEWFQKSFPDYTINTLVITSENRETRKNLDALDIKHRRKTIDIIAVVDMLNLGYHVDDLTGIVMYRCTQSSAIYIQQFGRALSTGAQNACVCFDVVDNLHRKSLFNLTYENRRTYKGKTKRERVKAMLDEVADKLNNEEYDIVQKFIEGELEAEDEIAFDAIWNKATALEETDVIAIDYLATYRELIAKTVAEVKHERVKRATEEYFRIQLEKCNVPIPTTIAQLKKMKNLPPPLEKFLEWQKVTEEDVLEYIDPDGTGKIDVDRITKGMKAAMLY